MNFADVDDRDRDTIEKIAVRAKSLLPDRNSLAVEMDITACHINGGRLDIKKLLEADDFNFVHDVVGIERHMNRRTGKLDGSFLPRCSASEKKEGKENPSPQKPLKFGGNG